MRTECLALGLGLEVGTSDCLPWLELERGSARSAKLEYVSVAPVAYQVNLEPGIGQFREFEPRRVHTRINSLGLFLVHKLICGKRESVS